MSNKKDCTVDNSEITKKKTVKGFSDEESVGDDDSAIDPSIIEDTFADDADEYNDVDML